MFIVFKKWDVIGILKIPPQDQQLFNKDNTIMEDDRMLQDYGLTSTTAKAQSPATVGLAVRLVFLCDISINCIFLSLFAFCLIIYVSGSNVYNFFYNLKVHDCFFFFSRFIKALGARVRFTFRDGNKI